MKRSVLGIKSFRSGFAVGLTSLILAACGGGGGGDNPAPGGPGNPVQVSVTGSVVKGHISSGTVSVYKLNDDGSLGRLISTTQTDEKGEYGLNLGVADAGLVALVITGGQYTDEATGNTVTLTEGDSLEAYLRVPSSGSVSVNITPLTTLAAAMVRQRLADGEQSLGDAITFANTHVSSAFHVGNVASTVIPTLANLGGANQFQRNYALLLAGFSKLDANDENKNVFEILGEMVSDIEADGVMGNDENASSPGQLVVAVNQFLAERTDLNGFSLSSEVVNRFNVAPDANNDSVTVVEDGSVVISVLANDSDINGDALSVSSVNTDSILGAVEINDGHTLTYTPPVNFNGSETFSYTVVDVHNAQSTAEVTVTVTAVNDAPIASSMATVNVVEDSEGVDGLLLASDVDGDSLQYQIVNNPSLGVVVLDVETGNFTYTPNSNVSGNDSFTFRVTDGQLDSEVRTVSINISPLSDVPVAQSGSLATDEDVVQVGALVAVDGDGDPLVFSIVTPPSKGQVVLTDPTTGAFVYTPNANANGGDVFTFMAHDGENSSNVAQIQVSISAQNDDPETLPLSVQTEEDSAVSGSLQASDIDGDTLMFSIVTTANKGSVVITNPQTGSFTYTPNANANGLDTFSYKVNDGVSDSNISVVEVEISAVNDEPVASHGELVTNEDALAVGQLVAEDGDGQVLSYLLVSEPSKGNVEITDPSTGAFTYTPDQDATGADSFSFKVNDGEVDSNTAIITINIVAQNDAPNANDDVASVDEDEVLTLSPGQLLGNDTDVDADELHITGVTAISHGSALLMDGNVVFTPDENYFGQASLSYTISDRNDGSGLTDTATVVVNVNPVNDAPVANDDVVVTNEDEPLVLTSAALVANDTDLESDGLSVSAVMGIDGLTRGTVSLVDGQVTFTPELDFTGETQFSYTLADDFNPPATSTATVTVTVNPMQDRPEAISSVLVVDEDSVANAGTLTGSDVDGDPLSYSLYDGLNPVNAMNTEFGYVELLDAATGSYSYTPNVDAFGIDSFSFVVNDGIEDSLVADVTVTITALNDGPVAEDKTINVLPNTGITGRLWAEDPDNDTLNFEVVSNGSKGSVFITDSQTGTFTYTNTWSGGATSDSFTYQVTDAGGETAVGTVKVEIEPLPNAVMFIVAHPDDEALVGAGVIQRLVDENVPVKIVVVTNGDYSGIDQGHVRESETVAAMAVLGVAEDDVIFLGYPDDPFKGGLRSLYSNHPSSATSYTSTRTGQSTTYGSRGLGRSDFHSHREGVPGEYNRETVLADLNDLINRYRPEQIYTHSIADQHPDHRIVYHFVVEALGGVMKQASNYQADIYTSVVHTPKDFPYEHITSGLYLGDKWPEDVLPSASVFAIDFSDDDLWPLPAFEGNYGDVPAMHDRFTPTEMLSEPPHLMLTPYLWEERVAKFVPASMQSTTLQANPKFNVLEAYVSQHSASGLIYGFGKNEEIYWRSDWSKNIAIMADITATSYRERNVQLPRNVADGIIDGYPGYQQAEWVTDPGVGAGAQLTMTWPRDYLVSELRFYDRPLLSKNITAATVTLSDGSTHQVGALPVDGYTPAVIQLDPPRVINSLTFEIESSSPGGYVGLAEIEVIGEAAVVADQSPYFTEGPLAGSYELMLSEATILTANAADADGDASSIVFTWSAVNGTISGSGNSVQYVAPAVSVTDVVTVTISDGISEPVSTQFAIRVRAPNIAPEATVTESTSKLDKGGVKAVDGVVDGWPTPGSLNEWASDFEGAGAWISLDWGQDVELSTVILHDRINGSDQITSARLDFSDGSSVDVGELPNDGSALEVNFATRTVTSMTLVVTGVSAATVNVGLAEIEVLSPTPIVP